MSDHGEAPKPATARRLPTGEQQTLLAAPQEPVAEGDWTGREIAGRYRVEGRIGEGGMGVVYVAEHLHLKKKVAFKVIHEELAANADLLLRFKREALATGQLDHPHIAAAIDFDQLPDGMAFMVMPWVRGHSLQAELDSRGKMDYRRACRLGAQIADALSAAHAVGIVHRDLKPDNVLLETRNDGTESCKVLDFGVASLTGRAERISIETSKPLTQAGTILGTPGYMSPEQATAGEIDHRTDLYALGVMLWELCRGERLFDGEDVTQIFAKQFNSIPPVLAVGTSQPATELSELVQRMLAWNKQDRPDSAAEVRDALRRIAELPDTPLRSGSIITSIHADAPKRTTALAIAVLVIVGLLAALLLDDDSPATATPQAGEQAAEPGGTPAAVTGTKKVAGGPALPPEAARALKSAQIDVLESRSKDTRRDAARLIHRNPGKTPRFVELAAELELNTRCPDRKSVIEEMRTLGDPRVLPALTRLAEAPRRGCGMLRLSDCFGCLRRELEQTLDVLEAVAR